ncbi:MAG: hypothetical protein IT388_07120 [Nitrospirales bacterium]|nr:hypothetical protein [Nitrospirales bacterium]
MKHEVFSILKRLIHQSKDLSDFKMKIVQEGITLKVDEQNALWLCHRDHRFKFNVDMSQYPFLNLLVLPKK